MSWQVVPLKVDWPMFLKNFPGPAEWSSDTQVGLTLNDSRHQDAWDECYLALRKHLPDETLFAVEWLAQTVSLNGLPKWKGFKVPGGFKPYRAFDPENYKGPASGDPLIPRMSPGNVVDMLQCVRLREDARLFEDVRVAYASLLQKGWKSIMFEDADRFLDHFREWRAIMVELETEKAGFAFDMA